MRADLLHPQQFPNPEMSGAVPQGASDSRLFSNPLPSQMAADPAMAAAFAKLRLRRQSILDRTLDEYKRVSGIVGGGDKMRLDAHVT